MSAYSEHADGLEELIDELGADCPTITYAGATIKVLPASARNGANNSTGGLSLDSDFTFTALIADFPTAPASNKTFNYEGKLYKIDNVNFAPGRKQVRISANDAAQGL